MRARWALVLLCALLITAASAANAQTDEERSYLLLEDDEFIGLLREAAGAIAGENIYDCIVQLTSDGTNSYRLMNSPTHDMFVEKHKNVFTEASPKIKTHVMHFESGGVGLGAGATAGVEQLRGGDNIIGVLPGKDLTKWVVFGGHYDNREATLGALDNASGTCTTVELARAFASFDMQFEATVVFAWWDGEEWGLYGSNAFVKDHNSTKEILGLSKDTKIEFVTAQSFDIVGINYPATNNWVRYGEPGVEPETAVLNLRVSPTSVDNATLGGYANSIGKRDDEAVWQRNQNHSALVREINYGLFGLPPKWVQALDDKYGRSDQVPFSSAGIPAMRIQGSHDDEFACYHQPCDTIPMAEQTAGGRENLIAGFDQAADSGGVVGFYAAVKGNIGTYWENQGKFADGKLGGPGTVGAAGGKKDGSEGVPGFELGLVLAAAIAVVAFTSRRRQ
jgi:hypothetical protein